MARTYPRWARWCRLARILFDDEDGDTRTIDFDDLLKHYPHQHGRQAGRWLVQQEQAGIEHEGLAMATICRWPPLR